MPKINTSSGESTKPTPWAVLCNIDGQVFLTADNYLGQLMMPDAVWVCPRCERQAEFDDCNYERRYGKKPLSY